MKIAVIVLAVVAAVAVGVAGYAVYKTNNGVVVPDVSGLSATAAQGQLADVGLASVTQETYSGQVAAGTVAKQEPVAGDKAAKGSDVTIWVSAGAATVAVPDLTGQSVTQADTVLSAAGLNISSVAGSSSSVGQGQIYTQAPPAGTQVPRAAS